jgi:hypothetical protein
MKNQNLQELLPHDPKVRLYANQYALEKRRWQKKCSLIILTA